MHQRKGAWEKMKKNEKDKRKRRKMPEEDESKAVENSR